jgi:hypothetical protein
MQLLAVLRDVTLSFIIARHALAYHFNGCAMFNYNARSLHGARLVMQKSCNLIGAGVYTPAEQRLCIASHQTLPPPPA